MSSCQSQKEYLSRFGVKATKQRLAFLDLFLRSSTALTASAVIAALTASQRLHKVTVYRMLNLFTRKGLLYKLSLEGRADYYELAGGFRCPHPHFQCQRCGAVQCLEPIDLSQLLAGLHGSEGSLVLRVEIRVEGLCQNCQEMA